MRCGLLSNTLYIDFPPTILHLFEVFCTKTTTLILSFIKYTEGSTLILSFDEKLWINLKFSKIHWNHYTDLNFRSRSQTPFFKIWIFKQYTHLVRFLKDTLTLLHYFDVLKITLKLLKSLHWFEFLINSYFSWDLDFVEAEHWFWFLKATLSFEGCSEITTLIWSFKENTEISVVIWNF